MVGVGTCSAACDATPPLAHPLFPALWSGAAAATAAPTPRASVSSSVLGGHILLLAVSVGWGRVPTTATRKN